MNTKKVPLSMVIALFIMLSYTQAHAFTAQLPIEGYRFIGNVNIVNENIGALTSVYTVPAGRYFVLTDVYITLNQDATGNHTTRIADNTFVTKLGPVRINETTIFSKSYTSGITFSEGKQVVVSDIGGTGQITVNLVGYLACAEPCS